MPTVNGKKYSYTAAGKTAAAKAAAKKNYSPDGYGPNPADMPKLDEYGFLVKSPAKMSKSEQTGKDKAMMNFAEESARQKAVRQALAKIKKTGMIPKSPTN